MEGPRARRPLGRAAMPNPRRRDRLLSALSRRTSSGRFIPEIDGLRFVSIALVVLFHLDVYVAGSSTAAYAVPPDAEPLAGMVRHGSWGVHLFFIISGFVLALPFVSYHQAGGEKVRLRAYFARRLTRLEPPYVVAVLGTFMMALAVRPGGHAPSAAELVAHLLYLHNVVYGWMSTFITIAWSLEIEVQFYLAAPVLGRLFFSIGHTLRRRAAIGGAALLAIAAQVVLARTGIALPRTLLLYIQFFLAGFLLADVYVTSWKGAPRHDWRWDGVWILGWAGMLAAVRSPSPAVLALGFPAAALATFAATFRGIWFRRLLTNPWIVTIGGMCYTIYLLHNPVIVVAGRFSTRWLRGDDYGVDLLLQAVTVLPAVLLVSTLFFVLVERPCSPGAPTSSVIQRPGRTEPARSTFYAGRRI
jgi:peptidoglycan/LPS O-acetylase OafA/YrhL